MGRMSEIWPLKGWNFALSGDHIARRPATPPLPLLPMKSEADLFNEALDLPKEARAKYLREACGEDGARRERVEELLQAHEAANSFMERPAVDRIEMPVEPQPGETMGGRYTLVEKIGEGGCGSVYLAQQVEPVQRRVALKVIKLGMDTASVIARFEAERQALARMEHPDIARVLDAGSTETGRPYFVMEYVAGVPITTFCDDNNLPMADRLALFSRVCLAIQHAHQKGIIHRDVKPSNVLVALHEGVPAPKVIDFGIAKATEGRLTAETLVTQLGQFMGTPAYMSPEQTDLADLDIDTRTDVYSLGVLLYELLTGLPPFEPEELLAVGLDQMRKQIREVDPPRPSTRLQTMDPELLQTTASRRVIAPPKLAARIAGDLDWVVMRCLEKDRGRRYDSAAALARDVQRHLANEAVEARPASAGYRLGKLVRRNRLAFGAAAAVAVALVAGIVATTWQAVRANRAEKVAEEKAEVATAVQEFLMRDMLGQASSFAQADAGEEADADLKVWEALARAAAKVGERFEAQPFVEMKVRQAIGDSYLGMSLGEPAIEQLARALELAEALLDGDDEQRLQIKRSLGRAHFHRGDHAKAFEIQTEVVAGMERIGASFKVMSDIRTEEALTREALGEYGLARDIHRSLYEENLKRNGLEHMGTLVSAGNYAGSLSALGRFEEALALQTMVVEKQATVLGVDHPARLTALNNLALTLKNLERLEESRAMYEEILMTTRRVMGPEHQNVLFAMLNLGTVYGALERFEKAIEVGEAAREIAQRILKPEHQINVTLLNNLAANYAKSGREEEVLAIRIAMQDSVIAAFGPEHPNTLMALANLGISFKDVGQPEEGEKRLRPAWEGLTELLGPTHPATLAVMNQLLLTYMKLNDHPQVLALREQALEIRREMHEPGDERVLKAAQGLASSYDRDGQTERAIALWDEVLVGYRALHGPDDAKTLSALAQYATSLLDLDRDGEAEPVLRDLLAARERVQPDKWSTFNTRSGLGGVLLAQESYVDAEPLLISGYEGMVARREQHVAATRIRIGETLERLEKLYTAWGRPEEAAVWRAKGEAFAASED
jgi:tetratricopeptide (TPR) repeat protein